MLALNMQNENNLKRKLNRLNGEIFSISFMDIGFCMACYRYAWVVVQKNTSQWWIAIYWIQFNLWFRSVFNSIFFATFYTMWNIKTTKTEKPFLAWKVLSLLFMSILNSYLFGQYYMYGFIVLLILFFFHSIHNIKCSWSRFDYFFLVISIDLCATNTMTKRNQTVYFIYLTVSSDTNRWLKHQF